jgi:hypothetical protein
MHRIAEPYAPLCPLAVTYLISSLEPGSFINDSAPGLPGRETSDWAWRIGVVETLFPSSGGSPCGCSAMAAI